MPFADAGVVDVTIASGGSLSSAAQIGTGAIVAFDVPTMTSAALTFQVSIDGVTYREALDGAGAAVSIGASTGNRFIQAPSTLAGAPYLKVRSGTSGSPVTQTPAITIFVVVR